MSATSAFQQCTRTMEFRNRMVSKQRHLEILVNRKRNWEMSNRKIQNATEVALLHHLNANRGVSLSQFLKKYRLMHWVGITVRILRPMLPFDIVSALLLSFDAVSGVPRESIMALHRCQ